MDCFCPVATTPSTAAVVAFHKILQHPEFHVEPRHGDVSEEMYNFCMERWGRNDSMLGDCTGHLPRAQKTHIFLQLVGHLSVDSNIQHIVRLLLQDES